MDTLMLLYVLSQTLAEQQETRVKVYVSNIGFIILGLKLKDYDAIRVLDSINRLALNKIKIPSTYMQYYSKLKRKIKSNRLSSENLYLIETMLDTLSDNSFISEDLSLVNTLIDTAIKIHQEDMNLNLPALCSAVDLEQHNGKVPAQASKNEISKTLSNCHGVKSCAACGVCFGARVKVYSNIAYRDLEYQLEISWSTVPAWLYEKVVKQKHKYVKLSKLLRWCEIAYQI